MRRKSEYSPRRVLAGLIVVGLLVIYPYLRDFFRQQANGDAPRNYEFGGATMGSTYRIKVANTPLSEPEMRAVSATIETLLADISRQMSTYDDRSEISTFNHATATNTAMSVSADFARVTARALEVAQATGGAFDPTIAALVTAWGFAQPRPDDWQPPSREAIQTALSSVGFTNVVVTGNALSKWRADNTLDLNGIAPGYAADVIAERLLMAGCSNVFVEMSGEIMARGDSPNGVGWRSAIETPVRDSGVASQPYFRSVPLNNQAIATSGDYRNYYKYAGQIHGHIIDPRSGNTVSNAVASVSVIAPDCMTADAIATALIVMGPEAGLPLVESLPGVAALFIMGRPDGGFTAIASSRLPADPGDAIPTAP